ncbi:CYTH domain-containing protein [Marinobacter halotolerans]|uniref:CYTH domain-containing protein n=1 Tax=Marinobacter halotolerans TaxID=1569211 RepID=UPI00177C9CF7|nr:CYTH domain-containing protein [Marinobacter halotolerans]
MADDANVELEIKLALEPDALARARKLLVSQSGEAGAEPVTLRNIYFDTADSALNQQRMALRVRQKGSRFIQTLKTQGEFVDGGHRRLEWEWPLESAELDRSLLEKTPLADQTDLGRLRPVFETNFERQVVMVKESEAGGETLVEVAIDQGRILSGERSIPLCEAEFELKSGNPAVLRQLAVRLAESVPVFLNVLSKAEQGYYLAGILFPEPDLAATPDVYKFFRCLSACWLRQVPFPDKGADFSLIRSAAQSTGVSEELEQLLGMLLAGQSVNSLISNGLLGRVQLALAGVSPD